MYSQPPSLSTTDPNLSGDQASQPLSLSTTDHILDEEIVKPPLLPLDDAHLHTLYEIERTVQEIRRNAYRRVALQFPDRMLGHAPRVSRALQQRAEKAKTFILGDTSYGSCCVDEIAAEHIDADVVVHYGRACLSPTAHLPVVHVFTQQSAPPVHLISDQVERYCDSRLIVMADVEYDHLVDPVVHELRSRGGLKQLWRAQIKHDPGSPLPNRTFPDEGLPGWRLFHIGKPPTALHLVLSSRISDIYVYAPNEQDEWETTRASAGRDLARRYALVTACSSARVFGILVNTLSVKNYLSMVDRVKKELQNAGRHNYTFVVGKVNAAKLANFAEIDAWIVIGCWESSLIESREFWKPLITPFELTLALTPDDGRVWTGEWTSDYQTLLHSAPAKEPYVLAQQEQRLLQLSLDEDESAPPTYDLRLGRYACAETASTSYVGTDTGHAETAVTKRSAGHMVRGQTSAGAQFLAQNRTWKGLGSDFDTSKTEGAPLEEGQRGIAREYTRESA